MSTLKTRLCLFGAMSGLLISGALILQWSASNSVAVAKNDPAINAVNISNPSQIVNAGNAQTLTQDELLHLKKELVSKQAIIERQRAEMASMTIELANYQNGSADEMEDGFGDRYDDPEDYKAFSEANIALLDETISNESSDPEWSSTAITQINDLLAAEDFAGSELISTNCATTLCRVETLQTNADATEQFIADFPLLISWNGSAFAEVIDHENGDQSVVYFISREGYQLPRVES